jgi:hydrogenase nickel incorporation protein HypA/HybF
MHELSLTKSIVAIAGDAAKGRRVRRVTVEVGKLSCVAPDALRFAFDAATSDTALAGATLDIRIVEGRARCGACGTEFATETLFDACACGSHDLAQIAGEELNVKSIEIEEAA